MRADSDRINPNRYYEIVDVDYGDTWYEKPGHEYDIRGTIIQPEPRDNWIWWVRKQNSRGYPSDHRITSLHLGIGMDLRPLNKKDQKRIEDGN